MPKRSRPWSASSRPAKVGGFAACLLVALAVVPAGAQTQPQDFKRLTLEELLSVNVSTLSRVPEATAAAAAALHVLTRDDIRRSGATSIPELLRMVPGVQVARINGGTWAVGVRGFADRLARSMLVLIDGRPVYSPLFAGTYWEVQEVLLEDVDRIEVIRGPGGTLWGANAVNGIINIITSHTRQSTGVTASVAAGTTERALVGARYGAAAGNGWHYRVYGRGFTRTSQFRPDGATFDGLRMAHGGFRADRDVANLSTLTLQGDVYRASLGQRQTVSRDAPPYADVRDVDAPLSGIDVLARWSRPAGKESRVQLQAFYTRTNRDERPVAESRDTFDLDLQHTVRWRQRHHLVWGLGYRRTVGRVTAIAPSAFWPPRRADDLISGYVQDEFTLRPTLRFTVGSKIERNDYSGVEVQPSARVSWSPAVAHTIWGSVTRAVRTPSRVETDYTTLSLLNPAAPLFARLDRNPGFRSEELIAYEAGYRARPAATVFTTISAFVNRHDEVLSTEFLSAIPDPPAAPVRLVVPVTLANGLRGRSAGVEVTSDIRLATWWRWTANYAYLAIELERKPGSLDGSQERRHEGQSPTHKLHVHTAVDLSPAWSFDVFLRHVSRLREGPVPAYTTARARLGWRVTPQVELSIVGQDLFQDHHFEWTGTSSAEIRRSVYGGITWRR